MSTLLILTLIRRGQTPLKVQQLVFQAQEKVFPFMRGILTVSDDFVRDLLHGRGQRSELLAYFLEFLTQFHNVCLVLLRLLL